MTNLKLNKEALREKALRAKRLPLLEAFDILKSNIIFGIEAISEQERAALMYWYMTALSLSEEAINNPPALVTKYMV